MTREILAIFELEFFLAALLCRAGSDDALGLGIAQDSGAELLIDQDAGLVLGDAGRKCRLESVIDDPLGGGDLRGLRLAQWRFPIEELGLEGAAVVERQNVKGTGISTRHQRLP